MATEKHSLGDGLPIVYQNLTFSTEITSHTLSVSFDGRSASKVELPPQIARLISPFDWPRSRKTLILIIGTLGTIFASFASSSYATGAEQMMLEWRLTRVVSLLGITVNNLGLALFPMVVAPFSEVQGRYPIFVISAIAWVISSICCAVTRVYAGMLVSRLITGMGISTLSIMIGGLIADMYHEDERNTPMAIYSGGAVFGIGLGPLVTGFIAEYTTWRWIFWLQAIVVGALTIGVVVVFKESREVVILRKKARLLNQWYEEREQLAKAHGYPLTHPGGQRIRWMVKADHNKGVRSRLAASLLRPFQLLFTEPVVLVFSIWIAFSWSVLYLCLAVIPYAFEDQYQFSLSQANAVFASPCAFSILATVVGLYQERAIRRRSKFEASPEARLHISCTWGICLPIGLFVFGWTCNSNIHWIVPAIAIGLATVGIYVVFLAVFNYFADAYGPYASSAIAAQSFCRNALGGCLTLVARQMYQRLGYGGASSLLGGIALLLSTAPWVLVFYGEHIRRRSKFATVLEK